MPKRNLIVVVAVLAAATVTLWVSATVTCSSP